MAERVGWVEGFGLGKGRWGGQKGVGLAEEASGLRERSDRLAASGASRAVEDWAPRSAAQRSAVRTARY